ncbi:MAG TPA: methyltransferase domain-containing protein [Ignavibacteria bacterium]|nr:methyltransferase domain-containing protein [Ignavibacteria bacterium]HMR40249.1 methyltransferase domain-containing protein [Ignavibacteria bacterium]
MKNLKNIKYFPLSTKYNKEWVQNNSLGENVLFNLETLCDILKFKPGMRLLDLGCGKAISSIFLAKEFGVNVWAVDNKECPTSNYRRISEMNCEGIITPLKLEARYLPFPKEFFDIIIAVDSYLFFGTNIEYTDYISGFLKPGGQIGIVDVCYNSSPVTALLNESVNFAHSLKWWKDLWDSSESLTVKRAEVSPANDIIIKEYIKDYESSDKPDLLAEEFKRDVCNNLKIFRMSAIKQKSPSNKNC